MHLQEFEGTDGLGVLDDLPPLEEPMQPEEAATTPGVEKSEQAEPALSAPGPESAQAELHISKQNPCCSLHRPCCAVQEINALFMHALNFEK